MAPYTGTHEGDFSGLPPRRSRWQRLLDRVKAWLGR